jgi:hypothetical protein
MSYKCIRCGYSTSHKGTFIRHIERVRPCKPKYVDCDKNENYSQNLLFDKITQNYTHVNTMSTQCQHNVNTKKMSTQCQHKMRILSTQNEDILAKMSTQCQHNVNTMSTQEKMSTQNAMSTQTSKLHKNETTISTKKKYYCKYCNSEFNSRQSKSRHEKKFCHKKLTIVEKQNNDLKKKLEEQQKQIAKLITEKKENSTLPYNDTNKDFLTDDMISQCMERQNRCVPEMIKLVHFNNKHPENMNLCIRNLKNKFMIIYDGNDWIIKDRDDMFDKLISDSEKMLQTKFMQWYSDKNKRGQYKKALDKFEKYINISSNKDLIDNVKKELKIMCYNLKNKIDKVNNNDYLITEIKIPSK